jgi:hypothetical protein
VPDQVSTVTAVAKALGVARETASRWKHEGAPGGPPYSISAWYWWAQSRGFKPTLPQDPDLRRLCERGQQVTAAASSGVDDSDLDAELSDSDRKAVDLARAVAPYLDRPMSYGELKDMIAAGYTLERHQRAKIERETLERKRIPIDDVQAFLVTIMQAINRKLPTLRSVADDLPDSTQAQRDWLRKRLIDWDTSYRETLASERLA